MATVAWSPAAQDDLRGIHDYIGIQNQSPAAAARLLRRIDERCRLCAENPGMGQMRPDLAPHLRVTCVGSFLIFFLPRDDGIFVVRVIHGARDYASFFRSTD
jgi:toxin ParE1/3/4